MHAQTTAQILEQSTEGNIGSVSLLHVSLGMEREPSSLQRAAS